MPRKRSIFLKRVRIKLKVRLQVDRNVDVRWVTYPLGRVTIGEANTGAASDRWAHKSFGPTGSNAPSSNEHSAPTNEPQRLVTK